MLCRWEAEIGSALPSGGAKGVVEALTALMNRRRVLRMAALCCLQSSGAQRPEPRALLVGSARRQTEGDPRCSEAALPC